MGIKNWLGKWWIQDDGYDPNGKSEQDGREYQARSEVRAAVLAEPLTDATRKIRRSLLALSVLALIINARLPIEKLPYFGEQPNGDSLVALLGVISIGVVYFLVIFIVTAGNEYLSWRLNGNIALMKRSVDLISGISDYIRIVSSHVESAEVNDRVKNIDNAVEKANKFIPELSLRLRRTENYYVSTSRIQMIRVLFFELVLPLIVAFVALSKITPLVWPMIMRIASA